MKFVFGGKVQTVAEQGNPNGIIVSSMSEIQFGDIDHLSGLGINANGTTARCLIQNNYPYSIAFRYDCYGDACDLASHRQHKHPKTHASMHSSISEICLVTITNVKDQLFDSTEQWFWNVSDWQLNK